MCGGTRQLGILTPLEEGLSPRVRGNPAVGWNSADRVGSIPACAGEPRSGAFRGVQGRVYPRVCGGTIIRPKRRTPAGGLSPRVRGNPTAAAHYRAPARSIPACAGEPALAALGYGWRRVYPRVCGGTVEPPVVPDDPDGLSPRVRGNLHAVASHYHPVRSIPACAGEPVIAVDRRPQIAVYPRVCGGTPEVLPLFGAAVGLSPRVRGNRLRVNADGWPQRSIPACAGEPPTSNPPPPSSRVYPRVCGGTGPVIGSFITDTGLSPRVRGNPVDAHAGAGCPGSIPACAGEPAASFSLSATTAVYPRVCGGTCAPAFREECAKGLSPRVRGNHTTKLAIRCQGGSIPACAGEPWNCS